MRYKQRRLQKMDEEYLNHIKTLDQINLVIMGKDPFPVGANGIPFCKETWKEQLNPTSSGFIVFYSLGLTQRKLEIEFETPTRCFLYLATKGIVFLNLSYELIGGKIIRDRHQKELREGFEINEQFLKKAANIVLCGEANKNSWNGFKHANINEVVHPAIRNGISPHKRIREAWSDTWSCNSLNNRYNLYL